MSVILVVAGGGQGASSEESSKASVEAARLVKGIKVRCAVRASLPSRRGYIRPALT